MNAIAADDAFTVPSSRALRRRGLDGDVTVSFDGHALCIQDADGQRLDITPAQVARLRSGWESSKYGPFHETRLWLEGDRSPLVFSIRGRNRGYAGTMRGFGGAMAAAGRLDRIESGTTVLGSLIPPLLLGVVLVPAIGISLFVLTDQPWWGRLIVPAVPAMIMAILAVLAWRSWPRRVTSIDAYRARVDGWG